MLHRLDRLVDVRIEALDGEIGAIKDAYFEDEEWTVRYLVIETGTWLESRKVLISMISVMNIDWKRHRVQVGLTRRQVAASPSIDTGRPVSRQHEREICDHYAYPYYWASLHSWEGGSNPLIRSASLPPSDPHLHSAQTVRGYRLETTDESVGHVEDFILEAETWAIRYLVIDTRNWFPGRHVVIPPNWIADFDWTQRTVHVEVSAGTVRTSPEYLSSADGSRAQDALPHRTADRSQHGAPTSKRVPQRRHS